MKKRLAAYAATLLASVVAVSAGTLVSATPASATAGDWRPCVTAREYNSVYRGMSETQIRRVFDSPGRLLARDATPGYQEDNGYWVYDGYYDYNGNWIDTSYYQEDYRWVPGETDTLRAWNKCPGFDSRVGQVGINFDNYSFNGGGLRMYKKVRWNPWDAYWG